METKKLVHTTHNISYYSLTHILCGLLATNDNSADEYTDRVGVGLETSMQHTKESLKNVSTHKNFSQT